MYFEDKCILETENNSNESGSVTISCVARMINNWPSLISSRAHTQKSVVLTVHIEMKQWKLSLTFILSISSILSLRSLARIELKSSYESSFVRDLWSSLAGTSWPGCKHLENFELGTLLYHNLHETICDEQTKVAIKEATIQIELFYKYEDVEKTPFH